MENNIEEILKKVYDYYDISSASKLAEKWNITSQMISNWKANNSINALKKKIRENSIYEEIFGNVFLKNSNDLINRLMEFYEVNTLLELAECIKVSQPTISRWIKNNSIEHIQKKCRELGIYSDIFQNFNYDLDDFDFNKIDKIKELKEKCEKYNIQTTTIENKKVLNLFEILYRDFQIDNNFEMNNNFKKLEDDIKKLILKYNPKIDKKTEDKFLEFIDKESEKQNS